MPFYYQPLKSTTLSSPCPIKNYIIKVYLPPVKCGKDKKYRARKKLKLKKDQRRVEALTGRVEELEKQVCLLEDALSLI